MGPTASGKSALAMEAARRLPDVEIVSADSMQLYRGMDIGTNKAAPADRSEIRHHLLDVADPDDDFSVARFQQLARRAIEEIEGRGHRALVVGGTGLYVRALVDQLRIPGEYPDVRAALEAEPDTTALYRQLIEIDPEAAARMEPGNRRRIVRALEVTLGGGHPFSSFGPGLDAHPPTAFALAGVWLPRPVVAARIEQRFDRMVEGGLVEEVRALLARSRLSRTARQALGYKELFGHLAGDVSWDEAREQAIRRTRQFARRQRVWFRRDPRIVWHGAECNPFAALPALLGDWTARCQR